MKETVIEKLQIYILFIGCVYAFYRLVEFIIFISQGGLK